MLILRRLPEARPGARVKYARDLRPKRDVVERKHWSLSKRSSPPSGAPTSQAVAPIPRTDLDPWSNAAAAGPESPPTHCKPGVWAVRREHASTAAGRSASRQLRLGLTGALVDEVGESAPDGLRVDQAQGSLVAGLAEQTLTRAERNREDGQRTPAPAE